MTRTRAPDFPEKGYRPLPPHFQPRRIIASSSEKVNVRPPPLPSYDQPPILARLKMTPSPTEDVAMTDVSTATSTKHIPWNMGKIIGAKPPLRPKHVWSIPSHYRIDRQICTATP